MSDVAVTRAECRPVEETADRPVVLVVGASGEIGRAAACALAGHGFDVVVHHRSEPDRAQAVAVEVETADAASLVLASRLESAKAVRAVMEVVKDRFGRLDAVVASDATLTGPIGPIGSFGTRHFDDALSAALGSFSLLCQEAARCMEGRRGSIVAVTGSDARRLFELRGPVSAATLLMEMRIPPLAGSLRPNVALSAVRAGWIPTESTRRWAETNNPGGFVQLEASVAMSATPIADPAEIGRIIAFLCSSAGRLLAGQILLADSSMSPSRTLCTAVGPGADSDMALVDLFIDEPDT